MKHFVIISMLGIAVAAGCQTATVPQPLTNTLGGNDIDTQLEFWHALAGRPLTSNDEAFHGLLLYLDGEDPANDYAGRVQTLKDRGMLPADFDAPGDAAVTRGDLAVAIVRALQIKGGLMMRLAPHNPRYATRELQFANLYPPSSANQSFSGMEFVGIIGRIEDYQRSNAADVPPAVLPGEMEKDTATDTDQQPAEPG